jgi:hypothetical protein
MLEHPELRFRVPDRQDHLGEIFEARALVVFKREGDMAFVARRQAKAKKGFRLF